MAGSTSSLRARLRALLEGSAGVAQWVIPAERFHAAHPGLSPEDHEAALERAYTLEIDTPSPIEPVNTLSGYALYTRRLRITVYYLIREIGTGAEYEATGEQSGAADRDSVQDRGDADGVLIRAVIGSLRNWAGLAGIAVIDLRPEGGESPEITETHARYTHTLTVISRDALPSTYGPTL